MKGLLIVVTLAISALARPDIGLKLRQQGYNYQPPSTNYGIPSGSYLPGAGLATPHVGGSSAPSSQGYFTQSQGYPGVNGGSAGTFFRPGYSGGFNGFSGHNGYSGQHGYNNQHGHSGHSGHHGYNGDSSFTGSSISGLSQVEKHVYFYDAPEDHEAQQLRIRVQPSVAKENVKIIFIKTPSYKAPIVPQIPIQAQNEEKTRVYVLVKKQDDPQEIIIPTATPIKQNKPEVFFIKYKTQKEAEEKIKDIQHGGSTGINANAVGSDSFVSSITDTRENHGYGDGGIDVRAGQSGVGLDVNSFNSGSVTTNIGHDHDHHHDHHHDHDHGHDSSNQVSHGAELNVNYGPAGVSGPY